MTTRIGIILVLILTVARAESGSNLDDTSQLRTLAERSLILAKASSVPELQQGPRFTRQELDRLLAEQKTRTYVDAILIARENTSACLELLNAAQIDVTKKPHTSNLMMLVIYDATTLGARELLRWRSPVPAAYDQRLTPITPTLCPFGFPAIHSLNVRIGLRVIETCAGREFPEAREYAANVVKRRIKGGMDWPTAIDAGEQLADAYFSMMLSEPEFQARLRVARSEWE